MSIPLTSKKRAHAVFIATMLIGLSILTYTNSWWPHIMLVIGVALVLRQCLRGRRYDIMVTSGVFGGLFLTYYFTIDWAVVLPVILFIGGLTILYREFFVDKTRVAEEEREDVHQEIEDEQEEAHEKHR